MLKILLHSETGRAYTEKKCVRGKWRVCCQILSSFKVTTVLTHLSQVCRILSFHL